MDTLVALGSTAAFLFSVYGLFVPEHVHHIYFMEAAAINKNGRLIMRVTSIGEETALAHIIDVVKHAQNSRAEIRPEAKADIVKKLQQKGQGVAFCWRRYERRSSSCASGSWNCRRNFTHN